MDGGRGLAFEASPRLYPTYPDSNTSHPLPNTDRLVPPLPSESKKSLVLLFFGESSKSDQFDLVLPFPLQSTCQLVLDMMDLQGNHLGSNDLLLDQSLIPIAHT